MGAGDERDDDGGLPARSAKQLVRGEPNVSYICSRYYRAPELIFGATDYTSSIGESRHPLQLSVLLK